MRFAWLHKLCSYLLGLTAFASLALPGELAPWSVALVLLALVVSWLWEPPRVRPERYSGLWNVATAVFLVLVLADVLILDQQVITGGINFLLFIFVNKLFNRQQSKDYLQLYIITFLMLVVATIVNTDLWFAVCFVAYVVFATWTLVIFHLRREMEDSLLVRYEGEHASRRVEVQRVLNSRRIVGKGFLAASGAISLFVFLGSTSVFVFFPRVGFGLFASAMRRGFTMAGFSETVALGQHGVIRDNPQVVMRVELKSSRQRPAQIHWRGSAYDNFDGKSWTHARMTPAVLQRTGRQELQLILREPQVPDAATPEALGQALRQDVYLEPIDSTLLFGASRILGVGTDRPRFGDKTPIQVQGGPNGEVQTGPHTAGIRYYVYSDIRSPSAAELEGEGASGPPPANSYLELPPSLSARVAELGRRLTAGQDTRYRKVRAVLDYLGRLGYTVRLRHEAGRDVLDEFLFERREGHCEYFATAAAVLLRAGGVPTRYINGFLGGEWNDYGQYFIIRQGHAHSWIEVFFSGVGWVTFDPTPAAGRASLQPRGAVARLRQVLDAVELKWFKYVVEYNLARQMELLRGTRSYFDSWRLRSGSRQTSPSQRATAAPWRRRVAVGAVVLAVAAIGLVVGLRLRRRLSGRDGARGGRGHFLPQAAIIYGQALKWLARHGHPRRSGQTASELAREIGRSGFDAAASFHRLTERYCEARFGHVPVATAELHRLFGEVRQGRFPQSRPRGQAAEPTG